jgi:hypothetical protein
MIRGGRAFVGGVVLFVGGMAHAVAPAVPVAAYIIETGASVVGQLIARDAALGALQTVTTTAATSSGFSTAMTALSTLAGAAFVLDQTFDDGQGEAELGYRLDVKSVDLGMEDLREVPITVNVSRTTAANTCTPPATTAAWNCLEIRPYTFTVPFTEDACAQAGPIFAASRTWHFRTSGGPVTSTPTSYVSCRRIMVLQSNGTTALGFRIIVQRGSFEVTSYVYVGRAGRPWKHPTTGLHPSGLMLFTYNPSQDNNQGVFFTTPDNIKHIEQHDGRLFPQPYDGDYYDLEDVDANNVPQWDEDPALDMTEGVERIVFTGTNAEGQKFTIVAHVDENGLIYDASVEHVPAGMTQPAVFEQGAVFKQTGQAYQHVERTHNGVNLQTFFSEYFGNLQEQGTDFGPLLDPAAEPETPEQELPMRASLRPVNETGDETGGGYLSSDGWLGALDLWEPPPHTSQCPVIEFPFFDDVITPGTAHCDLWAQHSEELSTAFMLMWSFLALWIMLGA